MKGQEKKTGKKLGNQGFTLIELIIVIAIIAILAVTLAPQLMKYIGKSKDSSDKNNIATITESVNNALADEKAYTAATTSGINLVVNPDATTCGDTSDFGKELDTIIKKWPKIQGKGTAWEIKVGTDAQVSVSIQGAGSAS